VFGVDSVPESSHPHRYLFGNNLSFCSVGVTVGDHHEVARHTNHGWQTHVYVEITIGQLSQRFQSYSKESPTALYLGRLLVFSLFLFAT
jgi:acyl-[acyl carrier protein]--UDP-N-acetylglucosamine O-acyltransferase